MRIEGPFLGEFSLAFPSEFLHTTYNFCCSRVNRTWRVPAVPLTPPYGMSLDCGMGVALQLALTCGTPDHAPMVLARALPYTD